MQKKQKKMRLWMFVIIVLAMLLIGTVFLVYQIDQQKTDWVNTVLKNPDTTAVVAYTVNENGELISDGSELLLNADTPLVLASTMKLVVLAAYESAVANGELDPNERIAISDIEAFYLPKTDGNAHINGLKNLGIKTDELGFALDQKETIALDEVARIMIHYSGNVETDYLISRLGIEKVNTAAGMDQPTSISPILGISLAMLNHDNSFADAKFRQKTIADVTNGNYEYLENLVDLYVNDPAWRQEQIEFMRSDKYIELANSLGWEGQSAAGQLFPKGTARDYARLMARVASGNFISEDISLRMRKILETTPYEWPIRLIYCEQYGVKDGLTAGVINLVTYCTPKNGSMSQKMRVVVILSNDLSLQSWSEQVQYQGIYWFQTDLARAKGVYSRLVTNFS